MLRSLLPSLALVLAAAIWGVSFVIVKEALRDASPVLFLAIRFGVAAAILPLIVLLPMAWRGQLQRPSRRTVHGGLATGLVLGVGMILQTIGLKYTTAANSGFLTSLNMVLVPFVGYFVYRSKVAWREAAAVLVAGVGIGLLTYPDSSMGFNLGDFLTLGSAVVFAFQIVLVTRFAEAGEFAWLAFLQVALTGALGTLGVMGGLDGVVYLNWTPRLVRAFAITILGATVAAFVLQAWGQRRVSAPRAALLFAAEPVFAGLASAFYLGEDWTGRMLAGAALVLAAVLLAESGSLAGKPETVNLKPSPPTGHINS